MISLSDRIRAVMIRPQNLNLVQKFAFYSIIIILVIGFVLNFTISTNVEKVMMERVKAITVEHTKHDMLYLKDEFFPIRIIQGLRKC